MKLTRAERAALKLARAKGGVHVGNTKGAPAKRVMRPVAAGLVARGFATHPDEHLLITKTGRAALEAVQPEGAPVFLRHGDGLTSLVHLAVPDGEVIDAGSIDAYWAEEAERERQAARDKRTEARRLRRGLKAA